MSVCVVRRACAAMAACVEVEVARWMVASCVCGDRGAGVGLLRAVFVDRRLLRGWRIMHARLRYDVMALRIHMAINGVHTQMTQTRCPAQFRFPRP